jgi:plasmid stability protein
MSVTVELSDELLARLRAEAARRGVSVDAVIADFVARLPSAEGTPTHRLRFIGIGSSGRTEPMDIRRERAELAAKRDAEGI